MWSIRPLLFLLGYLTITTFLAGGCQNAPIAPAGTGGAVSEELIKRGSDLYATHCQSCHGDGAGRGLLPYVPSHGPDGHTWHHSDRNLMDIVLNGPGEMGEMMREMMGTPKDAPRMPAWKGVLSEEDVRATLAYIKTFWTPEQRRSQQQTPMMP